MAFKPKNSGGDRTGNFEPRVTVVPKSGPRKARISLIIDLGVQQREDFEDEKTKEKRPQKPCPQVAVFADLVNDVVDYGGTIGKAQYRLCLNKTFGGVTSGINFQMSPQKDADGNILPKAWAFHPLNMLSKLAKGVGMPQVAIDEGEQGGDISLLLDKPFIAEVEVTEKASGKNDKDGEEIIYRNVNFKGASRVAMVETDDLDADGNAIEVLQTVAPLKQTARCIQFDTATVEDIKFIRLNLLKMIKLAENYAGSNMQKAIEAYEAANGGSKTGADEGEPESQAAPKTKVTPAKKVTTKKPVTPVDDEDVPF